MPNQIQLKDAEQDQEIALLKHRVEELEEMELMNSVREFVNLKKLFGVLAQ